MLLIGIILLLNTALFLPFLFDSFYDYMIFKEKQKIILLFIVYSIYFTLSIFAIQFGCLERGLL